MGKEGFMNSATMMMMLQREFVNHYIIGG